VTDAVTRFDFTRALRLSNGHRYSVCCGFFCRPEYVITITPNAQHLLTQAFFT
jgi:hypothetical protein